MLNRPRKTDLQYTTIDQNSLKTTFDYDFYISDLEEYCDDIESELNNRDNCCDRLYNLESNFNIIKYDNKILKEKLSSLKRIMKDI